MRRTGWVFLIASLFVLTTISLSAQTPSDTYVAPSFDKQVFGTVRGIDPSKGDFKIQKLANNLYLLQPVPLEGARGNFGGNVTAFVGDDGIVLIDPGFFNMAPKLKAALKTISDKPVKYVLNTHWHGDHTEADSVFKKEGAIVIDQDTVFTRMQTGSSHFIPSAVDSLPTITFDHEITLHINGGEIHGIHLAPGHTNGDTLWIYPEAKVAQMGDGGWNMDGDFTGGPEGPISADEYVLTHLGEDAKVIPGHGNLQTGADLVKPLALLKAATAAVQQDIDQGENLDQIKQDPALAKLDFPEQGPGRRDAYVERIYSALTHKDATPQPYHVQQP
jgi:cyclase